MASLTAIIIISWVMGRVGASAENPWPKKMPCATPWILSYEWVKQIQKAFYSGIIWDNIGKS